MTSSYPLKRMRRLRLDSFTRRLCQENQLSTDDLIYPVFVLDHPHKVEPIVSMPGQNRWGLEPLLKLAEQCLECHLPALALFPVIETNKKSLDGKEAYNPDGLIPRYVQELKKRFPELGIVTDVALDPYTTHGQDGVIDTHGYVLNDETVALLKRQALCLAQAGADIVAPSDMMDGRVKAIREGLDDHAYTLTRILAYSAKYASAFYGPFREAVGSLQHLGKSHKKSYQMNPANGFEALKEAELDVAEGADMIMVKPGSFYLDIIWQIKQRFQVPTFAFQVSGEYTMLKAAAHQGWLDGTACMLETLIGFKRAGCDGILSYFALEACQWLKHNRLNFS